jgi:hypothetical protein
MDRLKSLNVVIIFIILLSGLIVNVFSARNIIDDLTEDGMDTQREVNSIEEKFINYVQYNNPQTRSANRKSDLVFLPTVVNLRSGQEATGMVFDLQNNITVINAKLTIKGLPGFDLSSWENITCISDDKFDGISQAPEINHDITRKAHAVWMDNGNINGEGTDWDIIYGEYDRLNNTWQPFDVISTMVPTSPSKYPDFVIDRYNKAHIVWVDQFDLSGNGNDKDIFYRFRKVGGKGWGAPKVISDDVGVGESVDPQIVVTKSGNIFIVWQDNENNLTKDLDNDIFCKIWFKSNNTWSSTMVLSNGNNNNESIEPAVTADVNKVHVVWTDHGDFNGSQNENDTDIIMRTWNGNYWEPQILISNSSFDVISEKPAIDAREGLIGVVWVDNGDTDPNSTDKDIIFKKYETATGIWSNMRFVSNSKNIDEFHSNNPDIIIDLEGNFNIIWSNEESYTFSNIYYTRWDSLTQKWSGVKLISDYKTTGNSDHPRLDVKDDLRVEVVWEDDAEIGGNGLDLDVFHRASKFVYPNDLKLRLSIETSGDDNNGAFDWFYPGNFKTTVTLKQDWLMEKLNSLIAQMIEPEESIRISFLSDTNGTLRIEELNLTITSKPMPPINLRLVDEEPDHVISHNPVFAWDFFDSDSVNQGGFEFQVGTSPILFDHWSSGEITSKNRWVSYSVNGKLLLDGHTYFYRARVQDEFGAWSDWSEAQSFTINTPPEIISLTPVSGVADDIINIIWIGRDDDNDNLSYTLEAYYNGNWNRLIDRKDQIQYIMDTSNFTTGQSIDLRCKVFDGFEESKWFNEDGSITIIHNQEPTIAVLSPNVDTIANDTYLILWKALDPDNDKLKIDIYYDLDNNFTEKMLIEKNVTDTGQYNWDCTLIQEATYYICLVVFDGKSSTYDYSEGRITINHNINTDPPRIIATEPKNGSKNVPIEQQIKIKFNKKINPDTLTNQTFYITDSKDRRVEGAIQLNPSLEEFIFYPNQLNYDQIYTVTLKAGDVQHPGIRDQIGKLLDGNGNNIQEGSPEDDYIWNFSTSLGLDVTPPIILSFEPPDDDFDITVRPIIKTIFSDDISTDTLNPSTVLVVSYDGEYIKSDIFFLEDSRELRLSFYNDLEFNTKYTVLITSGVRNTAGLGLDGNKNGVSEGSPIDDYSWSFTTRRSSENGARVENGLDFTIIIAISVIFIIIVIILVFIIMKRRFKSNNFVIHDIFVIYNDGRLIAHQTFEKKSNVDEGAMSGMLTAIQNFVAESFIDLDEDLEKLEEIKYGRLKILLVHGKDIYLAIITSGEAVTSKFKNDMKKIESLIEFKYGDELENWNGSMKKIRGIGELIRF